MQPLALWLYASARIHSNRQTEDTVMKPSRTSLRWAPAAFASIALAAAGAVLAAQQNAPAQKVEIDASKVVTLNGSRSVTGMQEDTVSLSRVVKYGDLDLATAAGAHELSNRIHSTATSVCAELGWRYPIVGAVEVKERAACVRNATAGAMSQVRVAIASAEAARER
jgi:UrcA family protein